MTIRKGEQWGGAGVLPSDGMVVHSDAEARAVIERARREGRPIPTLGLLGGDLCRTVGGQGRPERLFDGTGVSLPCDVVAVELDGEPTRWFVAHLAAHRGWWRGRALVAMNAAWLGDWNLGPKAHPGDGLVDVTEAKVRPGQRLAVRRRLPTGAHLPHPDLSYRRIRSGAWELDRPTPVHLDGELVGVAIHIRVTVEPDAFTVVV